MKKQLVSFILAGFLLFTFSLVGQNNNYPTKKVNGVEYYVYTVQESEGLFAVGRKFKTSPDDISKANPDIKNGLKAGQQILIPIPNKSAKKTGVEAKSTPQFIQHKVEKKQTLFAISHKYNVSQEDIVKYNPEVVKGFKQGLVLRIPVLTENKPKATDKPAVTKPTSSAVVASKESSHFRVHTVKQDETLFSISKRYNVEISDVVKLNPGSEKTIAVGSELKIPANTGVSKAKETKAEVVKSESIYVPKVEKPVLPKFAENKVIKIGFLLPFMLDQTKKDPKLERFINFYAGALLAIEQAKEKGISFEIYTYDTENTDEKLTEVLTNPELLSVDLLIGPAFTDHVPLVSRFAKENKINTLIPFTAKVNDIDDNPYLFQFNPGSDTELSYLIDLLSGKFKKMHVVFAKVQGISPLDEGRISSEALQKELTKQRKSFSEIELSNSNNTNFSTVLKKGEKNLIVFNTDKHSNVSPFIDALRSGSKNYDLTLLEQYSWRNQMEKGVKGIYMSPFISDFNPELINNFNQQFEHFYGKNVPAESPRYDVLGYDLTNYFITYMHLHGSKFGTKINPVNSTTGIQSQPLFERGSSNSGFINQCVYLGEDKAQ
jgi:LysM repeat protein